MNTTDDAQKPMTLSREDLYELAWSKPMSALAADFGISDVALAKRCRGLGIPLPGRGYWARLDAGQNPYRPQLPTREAQRGDAGALTVAPSVVPEAALSVAAPEGDPAERTAVLARIASLPLASASASAEWHPAVKRTAIRLKHPSRSDWPLPKGEKSGPTLTVRVTPEVLDRALSACLKRTDAPGIEA